MQGVVGDATVEPLVMVLLVMASVGAVLLQVLVLGRVVMVLVVLLVVLVVVVVLEVVVILSTATTVGGRPIH